VQVVRNIDRQTVGAAPCGAFPPQQLPGERRGTVRAMAAWASLPGNGGIPALADLRSRRRIIAAQEFVLKTDPMPGLSVIVLCGDALRAVLGSSVIGATLRDSMPGLAVDSLAQACATAMKQGTPVREDGAFETGAGTEIRYRGIFMPLRSTDRAEPAYLFGAYGSRSFGAAAPAPG
jgi:hypothetical protein